MRASVVRLFVVLAMAISVMVVEGEGHSVAAEIENGWFGTVGVTRTLDSYEALPSVNYSSVITQTHTADYFFPQFEAGSWSSEFDYDRYQTTLTPVPPCDAYTWTTRTGSGTGAPPLLSVDSLVLPDGSVRYLVLVATQGQTYPTLQTVTVSGYDAFDQQCKTYETSGLHPVVPPIAGEYFTTNANRSVIYGSVEETECLPLDGGEVCSGLIMTAALRSTDALCEAAPDTDGDGLRDCEEIDYGTNPWNPDTDGDGATDGGEIAAGTDPLDDQDVPDDRQPPIADPGGPYTGLEGSVVLFDGTGSSDPDGDALTYTWDFGDLSGTASGDSPSHTYADNGLYTVCLTVDDGTDTDTECTTADIDNVAPTVSTISASADLVEVGSSIDTSAAFTDPGVLDTHTAVWDWGDETTSAGTVTETDGDGTVAGSHAYAEAGVYTVTLTVTDKDGGVGRAVFEFVVAYDPGGGFVTGGGWIDSPRGAYVADPSATGRASFGFVSKYIKGAAIPTGNTEFQFRAGDLNFHSSSYEWLVVAGNDYAKFKGVGTINGEGEYRFQIWAGDGEPDTFRIKIWTEDETTGDETVVYDNGFDQALGHGSIVIHTRGK